MGTLVQDLTYGFRTLRKSRFLPRWRYRDPGARHRRKRNGIQLDPRRPVESVPGVAMRTKSLQPKQ